MKKTIMKWALYSKGGFLTRIAPALMADGNVKIVAMTTFRPTDPKIMLFDTHKALESTINAVEAAMAIPLEGTLATRSSPFAGFVEVRIPYTAETVLPEPPPEVPVV